MRTSKGPWYNKARQCWMVGHNRRLPVPSDATKAQATLAWHQVQAAGYRGYHNYISAIVAAYLRHLDKALSPRSGEPYPESTKEMRRNFLDKFCEDHPLLKVEGLKRSTVEHWLAEKSTWNGSTKRIAIQALRACMNWGAEEFYYINPLTGFAVSDGTTGVRQIPTDEEHELLLANATKELRQVIIGLFDCGCRPHELSRAEARHYSRERGCIRLDGRKTRTKVRRPIIYLSSRMIQMVEELVKQHPTGPLFLDEKGRPWNKGTLKDAFRQLRRKSNCNSGISAYSYRHRFARDYLRIPGSSLWKLSELMNTSYAQIEKSYGHWGEESQEKANDLRAFRG